MNYPRYVKFESTDSLYKDKDIVVIDFYKNVILFRTTVQEKNIPIEDHIKKIWLDVYRGIEDLQYKDRYKCTKLTKKQVEEEVFVELL